jgi:hypothetical protein
MPGRIPRYGLPEEHRQGEPVLGQQEPHAITAEKTMRFAFTGESYSHRARRLKNPIFSAMADECMSTDVAPRVLNMNSPKKRNGVIPAGSSRIL